ncbi:hypothetical protein AMD27_06870 [Acinetobacter sp. TGL-Y2]|uniref:hypothetical protein n=1 Tax=Acinetobacter sp. TGL-Y2 TaxID=1407071 RepID=UPI0007A66377|nr:hypothetical protein [Acinetobacter sp. TGL-Y2]AMW78632.1 hypothetical protein AMD27_06870 [Acinetobacter sp. TGL-Y2]
MDQFIAYLGLSTLSSALVLFVLWLKREWFVVRLTKSIEHEYAIKFEEYKYRTEVRKKAEMVARLLTHWITYPNPDLEQRKELNLLSFECYLWLPDGIAKDLADLLARERVQDVTVKTVLISIRKHLHVGITEYQKLTNDDLTSF